MLYTEGGEVLARVAQRGGGCPIPGNVQGHVGWGSERPDPVEDVPAHGRGVDWVAFKGPFPPKPFYDYDSMIDSVSEGGDPLCYVWPIRPSSPNMEICSVQFLHKELYTLCPTTESSVCRHGFAINKIRFLDF